MWLPQADGREEPVLTECLSQAPCSDLREHCAQGHCGSLRAGEECGAQGGARVWWTLIYPWGEQPPILELLGYSLPLRCPP